MMPVESVPDRRLICVSDGCGGGSSRPLVELGNGKKVKGKWLEVPHDPYSKADRLSPDSAT